MTKNYYKPTPVKYRKIGDAIMTLGTTITGISAFTMPPVVTLIAALLTWAGKTISNFASED